MTVPSKSVKWLVCALSLSVPTAYGQHLSLANALGGPYSRLFVSRDLPAPTDAAAFPNRWTMEYGNCEKNAAFPVPKNVPHWIVHGVKWNYAEARSWPLSFTKAFAISVLGPKSAPAVQTQFLGNSVGVSAADGMIYAESDDQFVYALNAETGKLIWRYSPISGLFMGTPLVVGDTLYVSSGSVTFSYGNVMRFKRTGFAPRGASAGYNAIIALDRVDGQVKWIYWTRSEDMPTPAYSRGKLYFDNGNGKLYCLAAKTGKLIWKSHVGGMANMSSPIVYHRLVIAGMGNPGYLYALDRRTGKIVWKTKVPDAFNTGAGDVSPVAYRGIVVQDSITSPKRLNGTMTVQNTVIAYNAQSGAILWMKRMGRGPLPPAFKAGMPMVHDGIVYVGSPVTSVYQAYNVYNGKRLWSWHIPDAGPQGSGRGPATFYRGKLYIATGADVYALNPSIGRIVGAYHVGGRFGIVNPVIVGGTVYLANSWDWISAIPLRSIK